MLSTESAIVGRTNNAAHEPSANVELLRKIDSSIAGYLAAIVAVEQNEKSESSELIAAGVRMLDILFSDEPAWDAFKAGDPAAKNISTKGAGWQSREVATVIWRKVRVGLPTRERISRYGKAIEIAYGSYRDHVDEPEQLAEHVRNVGGVRGLLARAKTSRAKKTGAKKKPSVSVALPKVLTLFLIGPDRTVEPLEPELNRTLLIQIGRAA